MDYSELDKASVAWAYENSMELVRTERERVASLNDKAAQLAGFSGVILVILGSLAKDGFKAHLGSVGRTTWVTSAF